MTSGSTTTASPTPTSRTAARTVPIPRSTQTVRATTGPGTSGTTAANRLPDPCHHGLMVSDVRMPATVIIPAHNESASIWRLLDALAPGQSAESPRDSPALEVLVVCNGCTDDTAAIARQYEPGVRVMEIPEASKRHALDAGDAAAHGARRAYVDADVVISRMDILRLFDALSDTHMV